MVNSKGNILVAPLNWGLGHATRCIPVIRELQENGFVPIIASDGDALELLQKEFPNLLTLELPSYGISYSKKAYGLKWKLLAKSPKILNAIIKERKSIEQWTREYNLKGIISDNRFGACSRKVPSVFITHQLTVLSGNTTWITTRINQFLIKKFTQCWVPDMERNPNLSGKLGHPEPNTLKPKYIGPLSRLKKKDLPITFDLMVLLSGPEPQRSLLEQKLKEQLEQFEGSIIFVRGIMEREQSKNQDGNILFYNYMTSDEIETAINQSKMILCRSGYTTVMDLAKLGKKAFFIPTPGQPEQEYLAKRYKRNGKAPYARQDNFDVNDLEDVKLYRGLPYLQKETDWKELLMLFEGK